MSTLQTQHRTRRVKSENKWGRSNRRHLARQNPRKKTSNQYLKKFKNAQISKFSGDSWIPCPSRYTRGQGWGFLHKAWIGYKRSLNPRNRESFQDRLRWAVTIQNIQTDLGLRRCAFPTLGIEGDYVFAFDLDKELELKDQHEELKEFKKKKRAHIQEIVDGSMLTEQEREWMEEYVPHVTTDISYDDREYRYVERVTMPNLFDMRAKFINNNLNSS